MSTTLAGATFRQDELHQAYTRTKGQQFTVVLHREPENPHDANAIAVHDAKDDFMLGYIPRHEQPTWAEKLGKELVRCHIDYWQAKNLYLAKIM